MSKLFIFKYDLSTRKYPSELVQNELRKLTSESKVEYISDDLRLEVIDYNEDKKIFLTLEEDMPLRLKGDVSKYIDVNLKIGNDVLFIPEGVNVHLIEKNSIPLHTVNNRIKYDGTFLKVIEVNCLTRTYLVEDDHGVTEYRFEDLHNLNK